jgi:3,4-dihydroxy 2-butanone 4-phosphate synthase/GTP cyclohydrolase II
MARFGRGLICLTLTEARCRQLGLTQMARDNKSPYSTAFTVSIEAAEGVTTGISAQDRALTIKAAVARNARPEDIVQPGHVFPIMARRAASWCVPATPKPAAIWRCWPGSSRRR